MRKVRILFCKDLDISGVSNTIVLPEEIYYKSAPARENLLVFFIHFDCLVAIKTLSSNIIKLNCHSD